MCLVKIIQWSLSLPWRQPPDPPLLERAPRTASQIGVLRHRGAPPRHATALATVGSASEIFRAEAGVPFADDVHATCIASVAVRYPRAPLARALPRVGPARSRIEFGLKVGWSSVPRVVIAPSVILVRLRHLPSFVAIYVVVVALVPATAIENGARVAIPSRHGERRDRPWTATSRTGVVTGEGRRHRRCRRGRDGPEENKTCRCAHCYIMFFLVSFFWCLMADG